MSDTKQSTSMVSEEGLVFHNALPAHTHAYLWPEVEKLLPKPSNGIRILDLGCGNGAFSGRLSSLGYEVVGMDPSPTGIEQARSSVPGVCFHVGTGGTIAKEGLGLFDVVVALEVIEHVFAPRRFVQELGGFLRPGGMAVVSTPYHGYWKNLALALTGRMDEHFTALWEGGHIKFWSPRTLRRLFVGESFVFEKLVRVGRIPCLAKSMIAVFRKS